MELVTIGTARKPNKADLRARGLTGLPDPSPEVAVLRAKLESEQAELRELAFCYDNGSPESSARMDVDVVEANEIDEVNLGECNADVKHSDEGEKLDAEDEAFMMQLIENEKALGSGNDVEKSTTPAAASVADESHGPEKFVRILRNRKPIQVRPYAVERKAYRQSLKAGRR